MPTTTTKNVTLPVSIYVSACTYVGPTKSRTLWGFSISLFGRTVEGGGDSNRRYKTAEAARRAGERAATEWARGCRDRAGV